MRHLLLTMVMTLSLLGGTAFQAPFQAKPQAPNDLVRPLQPPFTVKTTVSFCCSTSFSRRDLALKKVDVGPRNPQRERQAQPVRRVDSDGWQYAAGTTNTLQGGWLGANNQSKTQFSVSVGAFGSLVDRCPPW